jgi:hypothetical protein
VCLDDDEDGVVSALAPPLPRRRSSRGKAPAVSEAASPLAPAAAVAVAACAVEEEDEITVCEVKPAVSLHIF